MFQVCNHSVLISPLCMGFGHQNCVFAGCPNSRKRLNKWAKQNCSCMFKRDKYLRLRATIQAFPFPTEKKDSEGRRGWTEKIKREIRKGKVWIPKNFSRVCSVHFKNGQPTNENPDPTEDFGYNFNSQSCGTKAKEPIGSVKNHP